MMDELQKAYSAYHQALYHMGTQKTQDPNLWYGIGILYERYGSFENAEEAFSSVLKMDPKFEKSNEIYFRLGIIYKQQAKYDQSLEVRIPLPFFFFFFFFFCGGSQLNNNVATVF